MELNELRVGNYINTGEFHIKEKHGFYKYQAKWYKYVYMFKPIPLTEEWLIRMKDNKNKSTFPDWIKYVHEAQNWYYWNNNKTELIIN